MARAALKLVESHAFSVEELDLPIRPGEAQVHSLHSLCSLPGDISPEIAEYCINRFSIADQVVLDPFCGSGTVPLQATLSGRTSVATDISPLAIEYSKAKLQPADIAEVALSLQLQSLSRPVALTNYEEYFSPFYDVNTYRELMNLKDYIAVHSNKTGRFIAAVASSLLHGHGASSFSSYSFSTVSLSPKEQRELNARRGQYPDFRAVQPRVLKKTAAVMRDGYPSKLRENKSLIFQSDARDLAKLAGDSVDLVITDPLMFSSENSLDKLWLKLWFSEIARADLEASMSLPENFDDWIDFMNEVSFELARVVKPGGRAVFVIGEQKVKDTGLHQHLIDAIEESLGRYWSAELHIKCRAPSPMVGGERSRTNKDVLGKNLVVFRRR